MAFFWIARARASLHAILGFAWETRASHMDLPDYLRVDEREDAISALEHAAYTLGALAQQPLSWKWLIIALHNALQGALVCTLSGTDGAGALSRKSMKEMWEWFESSRANPNAPIPREWLAPPEELYARAKDPNYMSEFGGQPLKCTTEQDEDMCRLNALRRGFMHFTPKGWSIETAGLPRIALNTLVIVETLLLSHPANTFRLKPEQAQRTTQAIEALRRQLSIL